MKILGIETSCDETAVAVLIDDRLASNKIASQEVHTIFGGVVPELASRAHVQLILPIVKSALAEAGIEKKDLDGIAVTCGPGLAGSLLVGLNFAKAMALALKIPYVGVNHMEGHLFSNSVLEAGPQPPFICLIVSGGHTQLVLVRNWGEYQMLGKTRDDAAGEAFDKAAKMLGLPYPGGPAIDKLAREGNPEYLKLPKGRFKDSPTKSHEQAGQPLDFSYSGLKTAVLYHLQSLTEEERTRRKADIAASFQAAAIEVLIEHALKALEETGLKQLALAGGVACNSYLRKRLQEEKIKRGFELFIPPPILCTDNGAMIARAGKFHLEYGRRSDYNLSPKPSLAL